MATVSQVLTAVTAVQAGIAGIKRAYDPNQMPDSITDTPSFHNIWAYPNRGTIEYRPGSENHIFPVAMRLAVTKQDIATASAIAVGFFEPTLAAFRAHVTLGGLVTWCRIDSYQVGTIPYAGEVFAGIEFVLLVQMIQGVSPAA